MKIGQLVLKTVGRDANNFALIVDIEKNYALIDGNVRRKKVNLKHLEPTNKVLKIKKGASTSEVHKALKTAGIKIIKKGSPRKPKKQEKKQRIKQKVKETKEETKTKKETKKKVKKK